MHDSVAQLLNITVGEMALLRVNLETVYPGEWNRTAEVCPAVYSLRTREI